MVEFNWTVDDIKRAQRDFSNNFMRLDCIRTESYDVAIDCMTECIEKKAADVQPVKWISVKDKFPEAGVHVLVTDGIHMMVTWCEYVDNQCLWVDNYWYVNVCFKEITHWMPLPEPPKDGDAK